MQTKNRNENQISYIFFQAFTIVTPKTVKSNYDNVEYEDAEYSESIAPVAQRRSLETYKHSTGR